MKVLFCTDGSRISYNAIENFSYWLKDFIVDVICVIDWSFLPDTIALEDSEFAVQCANSAESILDYSEKFLKEHNMQMGKKIKMCGSTVDSILDIVEEYNYDFIILGSHGKRGLQKWLGSVSQEIASVSKLSTFISKELNNRKKVLFTVDSSELSLMVIGKCIETLDLSDKEIYLLTVFEMPEYLFLEENIDSKWILDIEQKQEKASYILLNQFEKMFNDAGYNVHSKIVKNGIPAEEIIKYSDKTGIDLSVAGIRDRKHLSKFLLNSISKRVLENVKSDMLIVRV